MSSSQLQKSHLSLPPFPFPNFNTFFCYSDRKQNQNQQAHDSVGGCPHKDRVFIHQYWKSHHQGNQDRWSSSLLIWPVERDKASQSKRETSVTKWERDKFHSLCSSHTPLPYFPAVTSLFPFTHRAAFLLTTPLIGLTYIHLSGIISSQNPSLTHPGYGKWLTSKFLNCPFPKAPSAVRSLDLEMVVFIFVFSYKLNLWMNEWRLVCPRKGPELWVISLAFFQLTHPSSAITTNNELFSSLDVHFSTLENLSLYLAPPTQKIIPLHHWPLTDTMPLSLRFQGVGRERDIPQDTYTH